MFVGETQSSHFVSVHAGDEVKICRVRDASMQNQHLLIDHRRQRQPTEDLLEKLQNFLTVNLWTRER